MKVLVFAPPFCDLSSLDEKGYLEVEEGTTLADILKVIKMPKVLAKFMLVSVNGAVSPLNTKLEDKDSVSFLMGLIGG